MKRICKLISVFACGIVFMFCGCDNSTVNKVYKDIENPAFEDIVRGKTYYSKWFPNIQVELVFDTDKNIVTYTQYYASHYNTQLGPEDPPEYHFDFKYIKNSKYLFTEDLKDMALVTFEHYKTRMNGSQREDFTDFTSKPSSLLFKKLRDDGDIIKWNYDEFYTAKAMDELGFDNYILHPELIGPKKNK